MTLPSAFCWESFRFDLANERLWNRDDEIEVTPKAWTVLRYLIERPGQLITKSELLDAVWPGTTVTEGSLTKAISELRGVFGDTTQTSRFIQTVHRRGFRFIASLQPAAEIGSGDDEARHSRQFPIASVDEPPYISHESELGQLRDAFALALRGQRQTVFLLGEPGIGKTALIDHFLRLLAVGSEVVKSAPPNNLTTNNPTTFLVAQGQCIEQYGPREPFMPMLEALGRLCRQPGGEGMIDVLHRHAPTWLMEIPGLLDRQEREALQRDTAPVTAERMLRVMVEALEVMSNDVPIILVLEDLHWGDFSTLDLLSALAQRREPARLMVIASYRPVDAIVQRHPVHQIKHTLELHGRCRVVTLELLKSSEVFAYLQQRFAPNELPEALAQVLHRHTDGNPLFLLSAVQHLCAEGQVAQIDGAWQLTAPIESIVPGVPETLRLLIERRYEQLTAEERSVLDAASVAGHTIAVPALAAALEQDVAAIEAICSRLARRGVFLRRLETRTWPDRTSVAQYRFVHSLYERTLYEDVPGEQRKQWHQRIGRRIEAAYAGQTAEVAAELAVHFENAADHEKCIQYLEQAASNASRRFADQEAIGYLQRALQRLILLPESAERTQREVSLLLTLGGLQFTTLGYGSQVARDTYAQMLSLCRQNEAQPQILPALGGIALYHLNKAELEQAQEFGAQILTIAQSMPLPPEMLAYCRAPLLLALYYRGQLDAAVACLEEGIELCDPTQYSYAPHVWSDHGVSMLGYSGIALVLRGRPEEALRRSAQAIERAAAIGRAGTIAHAHCFAAVMHYFLRDWQRVEELGAIAVKVTEDNGLRFWKSQALGIHGAGMAQMGRIEEGIASLREGYSEMRAAGGIATGTYVHCMIAEAFLKADRLDQADDELDQAFALVARTDERFAEAELCRNRGVILLRRLEQTHKRPAKRDQASAAAADWFQKAIDIARAQGAPWWELRATVDLCRLWREQGRQSESRELLGPICARFGQDISTVDLRAARELSAALSL